MPPRKIEALQINMSEIDVMENYSLKTDAWLFFRVAFRAGDWLYAIAVWFAWVSNDKRSYLR